MSISSILLANNKTTRVFSDLDLSFIPHPVTGDVGILYNERAIIESIKNLIFTEFYERLFHPEKGCGINSHLFELAETDGNSLLQQQIRTSIENVLISYEPRANLLQLDVNVDGEKRAVIMTLYCSFNSIPDLVGQVVPITVTV